MTASRLTSFKRVQDIIYAYENISNSTDELELIILGSGRYKNNLEYISSNIHTKNNIHFLGFKKNPYKYLAQCNLYVSASAYEGFSLVLVEAMACGLNIVSSDCPGGPREILEGGKWGTLTEVGNVEALSQAIINRLNNLIASDKLLARSQEFSTEQSAKKYLKYLNNLISYNCKKGGQTL